MPEGKERKRRERQGSVEVACPRCGHTEIALIPRDGYADTDLPRCPVDNARMVIKELLDEGKSY